MPLSRISAAAIGLLALIACDEARAQGSASVPNAMQGFAQNRDQPVRIESAALEMRDKKKEATFSGGVKVVQGDTVMTSKTLVAFYEDKSAQPSPPPAPAKGARSEKGARVEPKPEPRVDPKAEPTPTASSGLGGSSSIKRLEARGNVVVTQKDQVVTGEIAIFDTKANLITMTGGVVLTQCRNVVRGDRLKVDMTTGVSRVESDSKVQVMVVQGQDGQGCTGAPAAPAAATPPPAATKSK